MEHIYYEKMPHSVATWVFPNKDQNKVQWCVTEKCHGANFCFHTNGSQIHHARRNDMIKPKETFFGYKTMAKKHTNNVKKAYNIITTSQLYKQKYIDKHNDNDDIDNYIKYELSHISVYGEMFGGFFPTQNNTLNDNTLNNNSNNCLQLEILPKLLKCKLIEPVVHLKGFGRCIDYNNDKINKLQLKCVQILYNLLKNGGTLVWDGDSYSNESFTYLIPLILKKLLSSNNNNNAWLFVGFVIDEQEHINRFQTSWNNILNINNQINIQFKLQPLSQINNYWDLGVSALNITQSKIILCFGGGMVLKQEYDTFINKYTDQYNNNNQLPIFYIFSVSRYILNKKKWEQPSLKTIFYYDKNIANWNIKNRYIKYNNCAYFDVNTNKWTQNCMHPIQYYKYITSNIKPNTLISTQQPINTNPSQININNINNNNQINVNNPQKKRKRRRGSRGGKKKHKKDINPSQNTLNEEKTNNNNNKYVVQREILYCPNIEFYAFDIAITMIEKKKNKKKKKRKNNNDLQITSNRLMKREYIDYEDALKIFKECNFFYAKPLFIGKYIDCLKYNFEFKSKIPEWLGLGTLSNDYGENYAEGIIVKPMKNVYYYNTSNDNDKDDDNDNGNNNNKTLKRAIIKLKHPLFSERIGHFRRKYADKIDGKDMDLHYVSCILQMINNNRYQSVISKYGNPNDDNNDKDYDFYVDKIVKDVISDIVNIQDDTDKENEINKWWITKVKKRKKFEEYIQKQLYNKAMQILLKNINK